MSLTQTAPPRHPPKIVARMIRHEMREAARAAARARPAAESALMQAHRDANSRLARARALIGPYGAARLDN
jgi:hypothetical protein